MAGRLPKRRKPTIKEIVKAYDEGLLGWIWDKDAEREWNNFWADEASYASASEDIAGTGADVGRIMLWRSRERYDPGAFGLEAQTTGDCVSHGSRSARDISRSVEIDIKGEPEIYYKRGATEPTYGARGHGGEGMSPGKAAVFERDYGWLVRQDYKTVVNLTKYNSSIGSRWGRGGTPKAVKDLCKQHNVGTSTLPGSLGQVKDLLANGYAGHSGQSWGTDSKLDSDGLNTKTKNWNHDMATVGLDFTEDIWTEPVFFVVNSWGSWNSKNPRWDEDALGPWIKGMIVIPADEYDRYFVNSGSIHFYSSINGFPARHLEEWGFSYV